MTTDCCRWVDFGFDEKVFFGYHSYKNRDWTQRAILSPDERALLCAIICKFSRPTVRTKWVKVGLPRTLDQSPKWPSSRYLRTWTVQLRRKVPLSRLVVPISNHKLTRLDEHKKYQRATTVRWNKTERSSSCKLMNSESKLKDANQEYTSWALLLLPSSRRDLTST